MNKSIDYQYVNDNQAAMIRETIWTDIMNKKSSCDNNDEFMTLKLFMDQLSKKCNSCSYRFAYGHNNKVNGVVWMTGTMRKNLKDLVVIFH